MFSLPTFLSSSSSSSSSSGVVTEVDTSMMIQDLVSVDDNNFSVSVYAYLGIGWFDPRL